jgi:hypothetical protein
MGVVLSVGHVKVFGSKNIEETRQYRNSGAVEKQDSKNLKGISNAFISKSMSRNE